MIRALKDSSIFLQTTFDGRRSRDLHITGVSSAGNTLLSMGKIVLGVLSFSFFLCLNAFYTLGMVGARFVALYGILQDVSQERQYRYFRICGLIVLVGSLIYTGCSVFLLFNPVQMEFNMIAGIAIAAFAFTEITLSIRGIILERDNRMPLVQAIKFINLSTSFICLALTQIALLSFSASNLDPLWNSVAGIIFGLCAFAVGVYMIARATKKLRTPQSIHDLADRLPEV